MQLTPFSEDKIRPETLFRLNLQTIEFQKNVPTSKKVFDTLFLGDQ